MIKWLKGKGILLLCITFGGALGWGIGTSIDPNLQKIIQELWR